MHQDLQMFNPKLNKLEYFFHPIEVLGPGSETKLQVGENLFC